MIDETQAEGLPGRADGHRPRVSIGLPVWNGEDFLGEALDSLLAQSFGDFELIIADNASTDGTEAICQRYAAADRRIRYVRNAHNIGLQGNTQKVLDLASAPYFMWACHDDLWDGSYLAKLVEQLDRSASVVLAGSNAASIDENGTLRNFYDNQGMYAPTSTYSLARQLISAHPQGGHATLIVAVMRTRVAQRLGLASFGSIRLHNRGKYAWDKRALFRMAFEGDFYVSNETLYFHRDVNSAWWDSTRSGSRSLVAPLRRAVGHSQDLHGYFDSLRATVLASKLTPGEKVSLVAVSVAQEVRYLAAYYLTRVNPMRRLIR